MNFSEFDSESVVEDELDKILANNPNLESLFELPNFMNGLYMGRDNLITFLSQKKVILKLLDFIAVLGDKNKQTKERCYHYPFYSFSVLSNINERIIKSFLSEEELLDYFFKITLIKGEEHLTSQGYVAAVFKNWLNELNPLFDEFVELIVKNYDKYIKPLLDNFHKSNAEIVSVILTSFHHRLKETQQRLFEQLLETYMSKKKVKKECFTDYIQNTIDLVNKLKNEDFKYKCKIKYNTNISEIEDSQEAELSYMLKFTVLSYLAKIGFMKKLISPTELLLSYKSYSNSSNYTKIVITNLDFFKLISGELSFSEDLNTAFVQQLFKMVWEFPYKDIIHSMIFQILTNLGKHLNGCNESYYATIDFYKKAKSVCLIPQKNKNKLNPVSLKFIHDLMLKTPIVLKDKKLMEELGDWKEQLTNEFKRLLFDESSITFSMNMSESDVKVAIRNDNGKLEIDRSGSEDKRMRDEENIMAPELLSDYEKLSSGSLVIQNTLFDSFVMEEPDIKKSDDNLDKPSKSGLSLPIKNTIIRKTYRSKSPNISRKNRIDDDGEFDLKGRLFSPDVSMKPKRIENSKSDIKKKPFNLRKNIVKSSL